MGFCMVCWMKYSQSGPHLASKIYNQPLNFRCDHCGQEFTSKEAKRRHEVKVGDPPAKHRCWDCGGIFDGSRKYAEHKIRCLEKSREPKPEPRTTINTPYNEDEHPRSNSVFIPTTKNPTAYIDRTNPTGLWIDDTPVMGPNSGAEDNSNESPIKNIISPRPTWGGGAHVGECSTHMPERTTNDGHDRDYPELLGRSNTQHQPTLPTADRAPTNGRKPKDKACPLCPPGTKMFKTEKSLQLHMHSQVHVPRAHYGNEEGKGWKMRDQLYRAPSTFEPTNYVETGAVSNVIDLVNEGLNGMSLASGPLVDREASTPAYRGLKGFKAMHKEVGG